MLDLKQIETFYPQGLRPFKRNLLREYLQYKILEAVFSSDLSGKLSFMGGTAIHIIHSNTRFSEDLDFDNFGISKKDFEQMSKHIKNKLKLEGCNVEIKNSFEGAYRAYIKISDILYDNKLSAHKEEKLLIQVDTEPQKASYQPDKVILNKFDVFISINAVPPDILLAQKIYAIFMRKRPLGRDFYDAIFLFGKTKPNLGYLKAKLGITGIPELKTRLLKKCEGLNFKQLARDVEQFLFVPQDAKKVLLFSDYISRLDYA